MSVKLSIGENGYRMFWCPGCDGAHAFTIRPGTWTCDDNVESPTVHPSLLSTGGRTHDVCHSFITAGRIEFLPDSDHPLAGQTVELPDWPYA